MDFIRFFDFKPGQTQEQWRDKLIRGLNALYDRHRKLDIVSDLKNASSDYLLSINETAKITISSASTPLNIEVQDGWYEMRIQFDQGSFAADQTTQLNPNNTTYVGAFNRLNAIFDTSIATDELDVSTASEDYVNFGSLSAQYIKCEILVFGDERSFSWSSRGSNSGNERLLNGVTQWNSTTDYTSLGTLVVGESVTGICYVKRIA